MANSSYKLIYFDLRARGEPARLILHYAKQPFEDARVKKEDWAQLKPTTPYGQLPVLVVDGQEIAQSLTILRFLGKRFGLAGKDDIEAAYLDSVADLSNDFRNQISNFFSALFGKSPDKEKLFNEVFVPAADKHFPQLEKLLAQSGTGFFGKSGVSWVDFYIGELICTFMKSEVMGNEVADLVGKYTQLVAFKHRVYALPQLQDYLKQRKENTF